MNLTKTVQAKVNFANFCINYGFTNPFQIGQLCQLVERRAKAAMVDASKHHTDDSMKKAEKKDDRLIKQIKEFGKELGLEITFPSCYASATKDGKSVNLPL